MNTEEEYRDINWSVDFCVSINGCEKHFSALTDSEKEMILNEIKNDYYSGTFINFL